MKKFIVLLTVILSFLACEMESKEFVISGEIAGVPDGAKVELKEIKDNNPVLLDSTTLKDGKFTLKGSVTEPDIHILTIQKVPGRLPFILENKKLNMALYKDSLGLSKIAGSKENDVAQNYMKAVTKFRKKNDALMIDLNQARQKNDTLFLKGFRDKRQEIKNENDAFNLEFLKENNKSLFAALLLENLLRTNTLKIEEANEYFKAFPENLQQTSVGIRIKERIDASMATEIGSVAPDFTAPTPEGKEISLNEIKGKVTIIDFWAAWCGPCRKENPNLVNLYNNYHDKGLEIIGVSLDGNTRQKDAKQEWLDAIEKDGLTWYQVSNLNYFNDPVAKKYNIQAIPATFILDSEGKIIDKNLRGPVLEQKISELLD